MPRALLVLVPYVLSCLTCLTYSCISHVLCFVLSRVAWASCLTCFFAPHPSLASGISSLTYSYTSHVSWLSCLVVLVLLMLELFEIFTSRVEVNHCDMLFLIKERLHNSFSHK